MTISMPPSAFNHLIDSQVRTMELATGHRPRYDHAKPYGPPRYDYVTRGRGFVRGRGGGNRGTRGRAIPGGAGINRRTRPSSRGDEDTTQTTTSGDSSRSTRSRTTESESRSRSSRPGTASSDPRTRSRSHRTEPTSNDASNADQSEATNTDRAPAATPAYQNGIPSAGPSRSAAPRVTIREASIETEGTVSSEDSNGTLGSSEETFLRDRDVPSEEVESALGWRMEALEGRLNQVSVEEDDDMADAEGEPAGNAEDEKK